MSISPISTSASPVQTTAAAKPVAPPKPSAAPAAAPPAATSPLVVAGKGIKTPPIVDTFA